MLDRNPATVAIGVDRPTPVAVDIVTTLAAALTASITPSATFVSSAHPKPPPHEPEGECRLLGPFALLVQAALGGLALLVLVYKRWRERPQRPVKIWFFDASKQVFGSVLVHIANIFMSMLTSGRFNIKPGLATVTTRGLLARDDFMPNPCSFYLLNLGIDVSLTSNALSFSTNPFYRQPLASPFSSFSSALSRISCPSHRSANPLNQSNQATTGTLPMPTGG